MESKHIVGIAFIVSAFTVILITLAILAGTTAGINQRDAINKCIQNGGTPLECRCALNYCN